MWIPTGIKAARFEGEAAPVAEEVGDRDPDLSLAVRDPRFDVRRSEARLFCEVRLPGRSSLRPLVCDPRLALRPWDPPSVVIDRRLPARDSCDPRFDDRRTVLSLREDALLDERLF